MYTCDNTEMTEREIKGIKRERERDREIKG